MIAKPCQTEDPPMYVAYAAVLLMVFAAGCARVKPDTPAPVPQVVATQPGKPEAARTAPTPLELSESLEQLRLLETGRRIRVLDSDFRSVAVDTPQELRRAAQVLDAREAAR